MLHINLDDPVKLNRATQSLRVQMAKATGSIKIFMQRLGGIQISVNNFLIVGCSLGITRKYIKIQEAILFQ